MESSKFFDVMGFWGPKINVKLVKHPNLSKLQKVRDFHNLKKRLQNPQMRITTSRIFVSMHFCPPSYFLTKKYVSLKF